MTPTSIPERLSPQDLPYDGGPHGLGLRAAGLQNKGVLRLPPAEPNLEAQAAVADVLGHPDLCRLSRKETETQANARAAADGEARGVNAHFERLLVDVNVVSSFDLFGLAEEDEVFKQEDVAEVLPPPAPDDELILAAELTLLFQVHLQRKHERPRASLRTIRLLVGA